MKPQTIHDKGIHSRFYEVTHRLKNVLKACAIGTGLVLAPLPALALPSFFVQQNLVTSNQAIAPAAHFDPSLINPWGISHSATSPFWISDNGTGLSTLYNTTGVKQGLVVTIPGSPTGQVNNIGGANDFQVAGA